jgi:two-component system, cell cycle sensor histidine kinase and response regulator CckA
VEMESNIEFQREEELVALRRQLLEEQQERQRLLDQIARSEEKIALSEKELAWSREELARSREKLAYSEGHYRAIVEQQDDLVVRFSPQRKLIFVNPAYCRYFGRKREELLGLDFFEFVPNSDRQQIQDYIASFTPASPFAIAEHPVVRPDGQIAWLQWTDRAFFDDEGNFTEFQTVARDITDRRRAEEALAAEKERLAVILRSITEAVIGVDTEGHLVFLNPAAQRLTGWSEAAALAQPLDKVVPLTRMPAEKTKTPRSASSLVQEVLTHKRVIELTGTISLSSSSSFLSSQKGEQDEEQEQEQEQSAQNYPVRLTASPLRNEEEQVVGVVLVLCDITEELKRAEEQLKVSKLDALGELAGGIAHDFNNLLTSILGNLSLVQSYLNLESSPVPVPTPTPSFCATDTATSVSATVSVSASTEIELVPALAICLQQMEQACVQAKDLTNQLLTFARGGAPIKETAQLHQIIRTSANFVLSGSNVEVEYNFDPNLWEVEVDVGQFSRVIQNLVINGKQAMLPAGGKIRLSAYNVILDDSDVGGVLPVASLPAASEKYVRVSVTDWGKGIEEENLSRIFNPYFTTKPGGSGLGLAICYSIIKKHGGHITVESKLDFGTTFHVYLPVLLASTSKPAVPVMPAIVTVSSANTTDITSAAATVSSPASPGSGSGSGVSSGVMPLHLPFTAEVGSESGGRSENGSSNRRILVMDDEPAIRLSLQRSLTRLGYLVETASDGQEAISLYQKSSFDAVIMDLTVSNGLGGKETMARLRALNPGVKGLVSSGYSSDPVMANFREYGFSGVLVKPYRLKELADAIKRLLPTS